MTQGKPRARVGAQHECDHHYFDQARENARSVIRPKASRRSGALTPTTRRLIDAAAGIMGEPDPTDRDRAFMVR